MLSHRSMMLPGGLHEPLPGRCLACPSLTGERGHRAGERGPGNAHNNAYPSGASLKRHSTTPHVGRSGAAFSLSTAIDISLGRLQSGRNRHFA